MIMDESMQTRVNQQDWKLWYKQPADNWDEALPIGNGRLGGMVFGGIHKERIQLNEDTLWSGFPRDTVNYEAIRHLKKARELLFDGQYAQAQQLVEREMVGRRCESYLAMGNLFLEHPGISEPSDYRRELDIDAGVAVTRYSVGKDNYIREAFVSTVDQVMVIHLEAEQNGGSGIVDLDLSLDSPLRFRVETDELNRLALYGRAPSHIAGNYMGNHPQSVLYEENHGLSFEIHLLVRNDGGEVKVCDDGKLAIRNARSVEILLAAATDFEVFDSVPVPGKDSVTAKCRLALKKASGLSYEELLGRHVKEHQSLFRRVDISLGHTPNEKLPTDERLPAYRKGESDPQLEALLFQFGRYLLMGSSRPGTQPANLQGIWNDHVSPPWCSDYTTNINTQMNYWPAESCNLSECHEPLFSMIEDLSRTGARTAAIHYGADGWTTHHNVDLWRMSTPTDGSASWAFWPMGGVWLCRHLWEHYQYQPNADFLREKGYPLMKGAALFCLDWLVETADGTLVTAPSTSPENQFVTGDGAVCNVAVASTMDMTLMKELFDHRAEASEVLGVDTEFRERLKDAASRLAPLRIGRGGRLQEWQEDFEEHEPGHRHVSHLYGLYPGNRAIASLEDIDCDFERVDGYLFLGGDDDKEILDA